MNPLCWSTCLWLWFMCTGVECLPKLHLSSRDQYDEETTITIQFYIDKSVKANKENVRNFLEKVIGQATTDLQSHAYFNVKNIKLDYRITKVDPALENILQSSIIPPYMYLDGIIDALTNYFNTENKNGNPDINCLVTNNTINNRHNIRKAYGFSKDKTLCKNSVSMLLAYAPYAAYHAGRKFTEQIRDSLDTNEVKYYQKEKIKDYLSKCKGKFAPKDHDVKPHEPPTPPVNPPEHPDTPVPIPTPDTPELPQPPGPPPPPPPEEPHESSSTEPVTTTTTTETPEADYC
uniref:Putative actin cytoskeleton organization n=1 Tax=Ixodes ricinus TaxID=34613 RepID=A0A6B0V7G8_IXORI